MGMISYKSWTAMGLGAPNEFRIVSRPIFSFACETLHGYVYIDVLVTIDFLCDTAIHDLKFLIKIPWKGAGRTFLIYDLFPL